MSVELKDKVRRFYEVAYGQGDLMVVDELIAPDCILNDPSMPHMSRGTQQVKNMITEYRKAFPDLRFTITEQISEGESVATRWTVRATHRGSLGTMAATNRPIEIDGMLFTRFREGKVVEARVIWDAMGFYAQLGHTSAAVTA